MTRDAIAPADYRFDHPTMSAVLRDMYIPKGDPGPGDQVEPFDLPTTDGGRVSTADLEEDGRPVLLVFGSQTCPVTESAADGLKALHSAYGAEVRFVMVNVREAHPGLSIRQPHSALDKLRNARDLKRRHQLPFEVAIDDLDGTLHRALGPRPNSAFLIEPSGRITFRAHWANQTGAIGEALRAIVHGGAPPRPAVSRTFQAIAQTIGYMDPVLDGRRGRSASDTGMAPPMGLMTVLACLFLSFSRPSWPFPVMAPCAAVAGWPW
jgi:peroxiredoxin